MERRRSGGLSGLNQVIRQGLLWVGQGWVEQRIRGYAQAMIRGPWQARGHEIGAQPTQRVKLIDEWQGLYALKAPYQV